MNLDELRAKYGKVIPVQVEVPNLCDPDGEDVVLQFVFKHPKSADVDRYLKETATSPSNALKNLCHTLIVEEMKPDLTKAMDDYPMIHASLANPLLERAGLNGKATVRNF